MFDLCYGFPPKSSPPFLEVCSGFVEKSVRIFRKNRSGFFEKSVRIFWKIGRVFNFGGGSIFQWADSANLKIGGKSEKKMKKSDGPSILVVGPFFNRKFGKFENRRGFATLPNRRTLYFWWWVYFSMAKSL